MNGLQAEKIVENIYKSSFGIWINENTDINKWDIMTILIIADKENSNTELEEYFELLKTIKIYGEMLEK